MTKARSSRITRCSVSLWCYWPCCASCGGGIGTRWSRFGSLDFRPSALARYLGGATGVSDVTRYAGHNPATSWFLIASLLIVLGLGVTGYQMGRGNEAGEDVHEVLAWTLFVLSTLHLAGVVWHRIRQRENLAVSMITGYKAAEPASAIRSIRPVSAVALVAILAVWVTALVAGYDAPAGRLTLPLLGTSLQVVEQEEGKPDSAAQRQEHEAEDD